MPKFIMLVGLPASGKSTLAQNIAKEQNANIHSSDEIRKELSGDINNQDINKLVFKTLHKRIKEDLQNGKNCIYDATNISYKRRMAFLQELNKIPCKKICVLVATTYKDCLDRNAQRDRKVPEGVIKRMYMNFNTPYYYEGWDYIKIEYTSERYKIDRYICDSDNVVFPIDWVDLMKNYNQYNPHHHLTLGEHCEKAGRYVQDKCPSNTPHDIVMRTTAVLHDCGKPFCQVFHDSKGNPTEIAHYYNHQFAGAYACLFFGHSPFVSPLEVSIRVMWHMQLYFIKEEKTLNKYKRLWGDALYNDLLLLHEADKQAH